MARKVLLSLPEDDLRRIDRAARRAGETRSAFVRRAALGAAEAAPRRPIDDPAVRSAYEGLLRARARLRPMSTAAALRARGRGRR